MNPLLAAIGDVIGLIITLAIIGFSVLSQILGSGDKAKQQQARRKQQQQRAQQQRPANPQAKSIESEIEDFLRQARGDAPRQEVIPVAEVAEEQEVVRTLVSDPNQSKPVKPGKDFTRELSSHVESHIGHDSISLRDAHLGEGIESADERIEQHLEEVFDHQVGHLAHYDHTENSNKITDGTDAISWEEEEEKASKASEIVELMKSPDSVKNMFIAMEIFKRPEF